MDISLLSNRTFIVKLCIALYEKFFFSDFRIDYLPWLYFVASSIWFGDRLVCVEKKKKPWHPFNYAQSGQTSLFVVISNRLTAYSESFTNIIL